MKYLTFLIIALTARVYIVASECWFPIVCNGIPNWTKVETTCHQDVLVAEMKKLMKNDLDELTDQTTDSANQLKDLAKKFELLKSRKAANIPPKSTVEEVQATTDSDGTTEIGTETTLSVTTVEVAKQITIVKTTGRSPCTYKYNSTLCYWVEMEYETDTNYADAVNICENQGSEIGQIYNNKIYEMLIRILMLNGGSYNIAWIGLKIDTKTGEPTYPSSNAYTRWKGGYPFNDDGKENVLLWAEYDKNPDFEGMINDFPSGFLGFPGTGVICQVSTE